MNFPEWKNIEVFIQGDKNTFLATSPILNTDIKLDSSVLYTPENGSQDLV